MVPISPVSKPQTLPPTNLPDEPTPFIGREREIDEIAGPLQNPDIRMMTLTGPGGSGKTRLALRVGTTVFHAFPDGVFFVSLASLSDPILVPSSIAEALGVREDGRREPVEVLFEHLKEKRLLLLLDNFEHLLDSSRTVAQMLDKCRELRMVVTSRIPLHLMREHEYPVLPLAVPDLTHLPDPAPLSRFEAVALFIDRASAVRPDFQITPDKAAAVAEICHRLDGLPLAIELASAQVKLFPPRAIPKRLSSRLTLPMDGARDRPARHQTLRVAIDWSYDLLGPEEQTLFARLSVFAGGCTLEAAEAICGPEGEGQMHVLDGMASLVEKNLLRQEGEHETRFLMLETIGEYATERLIESGTEERLKQRHAQYFLSMAEEAAPQLKGPPAAPWLNRLAQEHENLRAALGWWHQQGEIDVALRLAAALSRFWESRGYLTEGRRRLAALIPGAESCSPDLQAGGLFAAGTLAASLVR